MQNSFFDQNVIYNTMTFTGRGQVTGSPDLAVIRLGVETRGENLMDAQNANAQLAQAILEALRDMGVSDITTFQYTIDRVFDFVDGTRVDRGYLIRNILEIKTNQLNQIGVIIDTAVYHGANVLDLISFEIENPQELYLQALNLAVLETYQKARSIAEQLGISINPIPIRIVENSVVPVPFSRFDAIGERALATPIEPGEKEIEASVTVIFTY